VAVGTTAYPGTAVSAQPGLPSSFFSAPADTLSAGRKARRDFRRDCRENGEGPFHVVAPDVFDEAFEMLDILGSVYK
jgi:hypothetical protein